jgi:hypothetical protein
MLLLLLSVDPMGFNEYEYEYEYEYDCMRPLPLAGTRYENQQ